VTEINTLENLRLWFLSCPLVNAIFNFGVDYIGTKATECSIYSTSSNLRYIEDIMGNITYTKRQTLYFYFDVRFPYGDDAEQNLINLHFFENVQQWMYEQNVLKNFPEIAEGTVVSIMPTKTVSGVTADADSAVYEIQCAMNYDRFD
jgi:hypothetical protein